MRNIKHWVAAILIISIIGLCATPQMRELFNLPKQQSILVGQTSSLKINLPVFLEDKIKFEISSPSLSVMHQEANPTISLQKKGSEYEIAALKPGVANLELTLLGLFPLKSISIEALQPRWLVPGGHSIGVILQSVGIMIVGYAPIVNDNGEKVYPAKDEGIQLGDLVKKINGVPIKSEEELAQIIDQNHGQSIEIEFSRNEELFYKKINPVFCSETNRYRIGLFVRDGVVGVGTLSYWDPSSSQFAALGHIILDNDTKQEIAVSDGQIVGAEIKSVKPGYPGRPGEKIGVFDGNGEIIGTISKNTDYGIFGSSTNTITNPQVTRLEVGYAHQVEIGPAEILTVINGETIESFKIEIEKCNSRTNNIKNMEIHITDERLLNTTGGIIQGMSGSPIIQNNKLIGAVTHVFLNDPSRGYGVYMDNMLQEMSDPVTAKNISTNFKNYKL